MKNSRFIILFGAAVLALLFSGFSPAQSAQTETNSEEPGKQEKAPAGATAPPEESAPKTEAEPAKPALSAEAILREAAKRMYGLKDQTAQVTFHIVDSDGKEKKSVLRLYWKNYFGKENLSSKSFLVTESPAHDKGEKFLLWERPEESQTDIWLYLPELRQVRRLQSGGHHHHDKEDDSDLLFEDIHQRPIEKDEHKLLAEEQVKGEPCYVIESRLKGHPFYGKKVIFLSKNDWTIRKITYFSEEGALLKTQWIEWQKIGDNLVWKNSEVVNARTSRKTTVELSNIKINVGLPDDQFSERALR